VVDYLFEYRDECKQKMKDAETKKERGAWNTTQMAIKRVMASLYGMTAHIGYGWGDLDIANAILSEGRRCIRLLDAVATRLDHKVLYGFTDSAFIQVPFDEAETLASRITDAVQEATGNKKLFALLEAYMPYWLYEKKNKYAGKISWPVEDEGKMKSANFLKGSSLAPVTKMTEEVALNLICDGESESTVRASILDIVLPLRKGESDIKEMSQSTRIGKNPEDYNPSSGANKAALYYNKHISTDDPFVSGDSVNWIYVNAVPDGKPPTEVVAYRDMNELKDFRIDTKTVLDKMVKKKLKGVFEVLGWDLAAAIGEPRPAKYW